MAPRPIFRTARPYSETHWPALTSVQRQNIMDLLCDVLRPLGDHRRAHVQPSRGKKRKRDSSKPGKRHGSTEDHSEDASVAHPPPPPPEIGNHVLVGLNSVTRHLEALAAHTAPPRVPAHASTDHVRDGNPKKDAPSESKPRPLSLVLINHNHPPASLSHAHIPTLVHLSTLHSPEEHATRLLAVPPGCEPTIAEVLHIPHVGALGILEGAPGAESLVAYVREQVDVTRCAWIDEAMKPEWKNVKIDLQKG